MSNLIKRALFGSIYVGLVVGAILSLSISPIIFLSLFSLFIFIGIWEYSSIVEINRTRPLRTILDGIAAVYLFVILSLSNFSLEWGYSEAKLPYFLYLFYIFVRAIYSDREKMPSELGKVILGQVYILGGLYSASLIGYMGRSFDIAPLLIVCICIWSNDTGAFLAGSAFGKRRLFPSVSPKKSWEGFWGGMIASILTAIILGYWISSTPILIWKLVLIGVVVSVVSTWGDLFESMLKRQAGVKDSGNIIPGHGGILDRIDSMLFVFPAVYVLLCFIF